jgi:Tol biopolymer transport system component
MLRLLGKLLVAAALCAGFTSIQAQPVLVGRVTHPITDAQANSGTRDPALSEDGRYLFFVSTANTLGPPANGSLNLYRYDLSGIPHPADSLLLAMSVLGSGNSFAPSASSDGERFAFETLAGNLGGTQGSFTDIYFGQSFPLPQNEVGFELSLVTRGLGNTAANGEARTPSVSGNGRFIAYYSDSNNLVSGDSNNEPDIFLADAENLTAPPERISVDSGEVPFTGRSFFLSNNAVSFDARFVVFTARAPAGVTTNISDIFLRDRIAGTTMLVSRLSNGTPFNGSSDQAAISSDARFVVFRSFASNGPSPSGSRIWFVDRLANTIGSVPLPPATSACEEPRVSNRADVIMQCSSSVVGVSMQAYLYRGSNGSIYRLSSTPGNGNGNGSGGDFMDISADGYFIAFDSAASDLVSGDTNSSTDSFLTIDDFILSHIFSDGFE